MKLVIDGPNEKQALFLLDKHKYIAYGGARGGGKSWAVRTKAKLMALRYPGIRLLIVRRSYPELINNHINTLRKELLGIAKYNDKDKVLRFINGSTINFTYCDRDQDLDRLQGVEYDVIFLDEATQLSEYQMKTIVACVRGVNDFPKRVYFTCNPGGQGHGYIKRLFIDRRFESGENPADYAFIQALVRDNTALMQTQPEYIRQLEALPPHLREMWLEGRWDVFAGQFFEEFRLDPDPALCKLAGVTAEEAAQQHRFTHVIAPFRIPRGGRSTAATTSDTTGRSRWRGGPWTTTGYYTGSKSFTGARASRTRACARRRTSSSGGRWRLSGQTRCSRGGRLRAAWPTRPAGTHRAARAYRRRRGGTASTSSRGTTPGLRDGCSATTGCSSTRRDMRGATSSTHARTLSGRSRC